MAFSSQVTAILPFEMDATLKSTHIGTFMRQLPRDVLARLAAQPPSAFGIFQCVCRAEEGEAGRDGASELLQLSLSNLS